MVPHLIFAEAIPAHVEGLKAGIDRQSLYYHRQLFAPPGGIEHGDLWLQLADA